MLEVLTISSVLPFLALVVENSEIPTPYDIGKLKFVLEKYIGDGVLVATLAFVVVITLSTSVRIIAIFLNTYFSFSVGTDLSCRMLVKSLNIEFEEFRKQNSTFYVNSIMRKSGVLMQNIVLGSIQILSNFIIINVILITLFVLHSSMIVYLLILLCCIYTFIILVTSNITKKISTNLASVTTQAMKMLNEIYGSFVYLRITDQVLDVVEYYRSVDLKFRRAEAVGLFLSQAPRYLIEGLVIISCALYIYILSLSSTEISAELYGLLTIIIALQRVLPYAQQIYSNFVSFKVFKDTAHEIADLLNLTYVFAEKTQKDSVNSFQKVEFRNISYWFSEPKLQLFDQINIEVEKGDWMAITGRTGSGKSTLLSIMTGLLKPAHGQVILNGNVANLHDNTQWFRLVSYVPQKNFFPDVSVEEFITNKKELSVLDREKMWEVINICCLDDVFNARKRKTVELLGENGSRFSGGQLQRLSIARELFKHRPILVLDEATSALDIATQREILTRIKDHYPTLTVIMVAHRKEIFDQFGKQVNL